MNSLRRPSETAFDSARVVGEVGEVLEERPVARTLPPGRASARTAPVSTNRRRDLRSLTLLVRWQRRSPCGRLPSLVMVLHIAEEMVRRHPDRRPAVPSPAIFRPAPGVDVRGLERRRQVGDRAEVTVVAGPLAGDHRVQGVMEVVAPLGVDAAATSGSHGRTTRGSFRSLSAISTRCRPRCASSASTSVASCSRKWIADVSMIACTASRRRPSR